ncbi:hypothetical protein F2Q69_00055199 [Brassica cretica]|uniref:Uncharacterized protein n=1 Tax=Brassica cretica TaxID=69181 RepID=A0A8S9MUZ0_BRACR|nr:hypothetical protein F2Q69_00055199 [Brassica cretica]
MSIDYDSTRSIDNNDCMSIDTTDILNKETNPKTITFGIKVNVVHNKLCSDHDSVYKSLKEISSELNIGGRYEEEAIVRCTSSAVDRYSREASTIED